MKIPMGTEELLEQIIYRRFNKGQSVNQIYKWIRSLKSDDGETIGVSRSYELIRIARDSVGDYNNYMNPNVLEESIELMERMRSDAIENDDKSLAYKWHTEINKVNGLHKHKVDITSGDEKIVININTNTTTNKDQKEN